MGGKIVQDVTVKWFGLVLTGLSAAVVFVVLAWSVNKGFELSDESYYCLSTENPHSNSMLNSYFGLITHRLCFGVTDLRWLRICHLVYQLAATIYFAISFLKFFSRWYSFVLSARTLIVLSLIVASALHFDYLPLAMSYNSWSLILSLLFMSFALQSQVAGTKVRAGFYIAMGFCSALLFFNKMPNGPAVLGVFTLQLLLFQRKRVGTWVLGSGAGIVLGAVFLFRSPTLALDKAASLIQNLRAISGSALGAYVDHFRAFVLEEPGWKLILTEVVFLAGMWMLGRLKVPRWLAVLIPTVNLTLLFLYSKGSSYNVTNDFAIIFIGICTAIGGILFVREQFFMPREAAFMMGLFFLLPFLLAFGTSNVIFYTASQLSIFFVASVLLLLIGLRGEVEAALLPITCSALCVVFVLVIVNGTVFHPYRQEPLSSKTIPLVFSASTESILESPERFVMLANLTERLKRWNNDGRAVLASPPVLGTIILAGMKPDEVFWLVDDPRFIDVNRYYLSKWKPAALPFLLLSADIIKSPAQNALLKDSGVDIRNDYHLCDSVYMPLNQQYFYFCKPLER